MSEKTTNIRLFNCCLPTIRDSCHLLPTHQRRTPFTKVTSRPRRQQLTNRHDPNEDEPIISGGRGRPRPGGVAGPAPAPDPSARVAVGARRALATVTVDWRTGAFRRRDDRPLICAGVCFFPGAVVCFIPGAVVVLFSVREKKNGWYLQVCEGAWWTVLNLAVVGFCKFSY